MGKVDFFNSNRFYLGYSSDVRVVIIISSLSIFIPIIVISTAQSNYELAGSFILIGLILFLALCFERDMIVQICKDGLIITKTATIYHKEERFHIPYNNITNIYLKRVFGINYFYDVYVISSTGNSDIKLLPINKKNLQLKYHLDNIKAKIRSNNDCLKLDENISREKVVISKWEKICFILLIVFHKIIRRLF